MSKHNNIHWLREKELYSLKKEYYGNFSRRGASTTRDSEVYRRLVSKYYNEHYGFYHTAPKHYRKTLNRIQRARSKQSIIKLLKGYDVSFEDNYKDCSWWW